MTRRSRRSLPAVMLAVVGLAGAAPAQVVVTPQPVAPPGPIVQGQDAEGQVTRISRAERTITLDTGAEYVVPEALGTAWAVVTDGAYVKLRYDVEGGRNIVTLIQVTAR